MRTAYIIGCISHGLNDATIGGAVMITYVLFLKKIRISYFLPFLAIFTICFLLLPTAFAATVTVSWDANTEPDIEGYILYYGPTSPDYLYNVDVGNSTSCTISGLEQGEVYYFAATAYNSFGESGFSEEVTYEIPFDSGMPDEVIIDNGDEGTSFTGTWGISSGPDPYGESSLYSNDPEAHYTYEASIAGKYTVSLWWTEHAIWRINSVPVQIFDDDSLLDTIYVNQQTNGGQWNVLGEYDFSGTARVVVVSETDGSAGNNSTCVDALRLVSADAAPDDIFHISASAGSGGYISPDGDVTVSRGSSESFVIVADSNHHIVDVTVDGTSIGPASSYTFNDVNQEHTIAATFALNTYTIAASAEGCGTISPRGTIVVDHGSNQIYSIMPNENCHIVDVKVGGNPVGTPSTYSFDNVTADHTITASFAVDTHTITASAGANGTISPLGAVSVDNGSNQPFTITPDTGYQVADVVVDGTSVGAVTSYSFNNVTAEHTIAASFAADTHTITASAGANGTISPLGAVSVDNGSNQPFTITPDTGYQVADVKVDGTSVGAVTSYSFSNVTEDHTIVASFAVDTPDTHTISASAGPNGTISPAGNTLVTHGSDQTFIITPNENYQVNEIIVDGTSVPPSSNYTFSNIIGNHEISVTFEIDASKSPNEIIIDNGDEGTSFTGKWRVSSCPNPYGKNSLYSWNRDVYYAYQAPVNGTYTVLLWWTEHKNMRSNSVPVEIFDGDTLLDTVYVNQRTNGGQWNVLGQYVFSGTARVVVISEGDRTTGVDALRFSR